MKKFILAFSLGVFLSHLSIAQSSDFEYFIFAKDTRKESYRFKISGEQSENLLNSLFVKYADTKRSGYEWKFKNMEMEGFESPITLFVQQGVQGGEGDNYYFFRPFRNEKNKEHLLTHCAKEGEFQTALVIYVKKKGKNYITNREEAMLVTKYLETMY